MDRRIPPLTIAGLLAIGAVPSPHGHGAYPSSGDSHPDHIELEANTSRVSNSVPMAQGSSTAQRPVGRYVDGNDVAIRSYFEAHQAAFYAATSAWMHTPLTTASA